MLFVADSAYRWYKLQYVALRKNVITLLKYAADMYRVVQINTASLCRIINNSYYIV